MSVPAPPARRASCAHCTRPASHCLCAWIPALDADTRVLLLQHPDEAAHPLNTARLVALGLRGARLWVGEHFDALPDELAARGQRPLLLFPGAPAVDANAWRVEQADIPTLLVVLDGTWRRARRLLRLNPLLGTLPRLALQPQAPSRYRVRRAREPDALATVEAVAAALGMLEPARDFAPLLAPFEQMVEGQLQARQARTGACGLGLAHRVR